MERADRYIVIKRADYEKHLSREGRIAFDNCLASIAEGRQREGKTPTSYVVVGDDWPMYEDTFKSIEKWVDGMEEVKKEVKLCPVCAGPGITLPNQNILCESNECVEAKSLEVWNGMVRMYGKA